MAGDRRQPHRYVVRATADAPDARQPDHQSLTTVSQASADDRWGSAGWLLVGLALFLLVVSGTLSGVVRDLTAWHAGDRQRPAGIPLSAPVLGDGTRPDRDVALAAGLAPLAALDESRRGLVTVSTREGRAVAHALIQAVRTAPDPPDDGYDRSRFGSPWSDATDRVYGRNGCDTRNDILARDLHDPVFERGSACVVVGGTLDDPYTGAIIEFTKADAAAVHIDHIYPLSVAWRMGAVRWDPATRLAFANDPLNLVAVDGPANEDKGALTPSEWLPTDGADRCAFAVRYAAIAIRYDLPVTPADRRTMNEQCR